MHSKFIYFPPDIILFTSLPTYQNISKYSKKIFSLTYLNRNIEFVSSLSSGKREIFAFKLIGGILMW